MAPLSEARLARYILEIRGRQTAPPLSSTVGEKFRLDQADNIFPPTYIKESK